VNRGTQDNPTRCTCSICKGYKWSHLPWWVHTPFEVYRVIRDKRVYQFTREEFKKFVAAGAPLDAFDEGAASGRTRMLDQVQGGYLDWETYWTLDVIEPKHGIQVHSLKEMAEEEEHGMNYSFDDEAGGVFPIVFKRNGRALTKDGIWIKKGKT